MLKDRASLIDPSCPSHLRTKQPSHQGTFRPRNLHTKNLHTKQPSHQTTFTPNNLHTKEPSHQEPSHQTTFTPRNLHTKQPSHQGTFTSNNLHTKQPSHQVSHQRDEQVSGWRARSSMMLTPTDRQSSLFIRCIFCGFWKPLLELP